MFLLQEIFSKNMLPVIKIFPVLKTSFAPLTNLIIFNFDKSQNHQAPSCFFYLVCQSKSRKHGQKYRYQETQFSEKIPKIKL